MNSAAALSSVPASSALAFPAVARFRFMLRAEDRIRLPDYAGSAWRGLLGHGLRRTACVTRQPTCEGCLLVHNCVYSTLFETPATPQAAKHGYSALPHPFVLDIDPTLPRQLDPGMDYPLSVHLFGAAITQLPYLIHAFNVAGQHGIGNARGRFMVASVQHERSLGSQDWQAVYVCTEGVYKAAEPGPLVPPPAPPAAARLRLVTPLRIKRDGGFLGAGRLTALDFVRALCRRLTTLALLQGGDPANFAAQRLLPDPTAINLHADWMRWHEWTRYSSRQRAEMQFGGLIGEIELQGAGLAALWPALWLGQWTHVGKGTAFGLGGYRIASGSGEAARNLQHKLVKTARVGERDETGRR